MATITREADTLNWHLREEHEDKTARAAYRAWGICPECGWYLPSPHQRIGTRPIDFITEDIVCQDMNHYPQRLQELYEKKGDK